MPAKYHFISSYRLRAARHAGGPGVIRLAALAMIIGILVGCSSPSPQPVATTAPEAQEVPEAAPKVIVGVDANHTAITEPLTEIIPAERANDARVAITFEAAEPPVLLGIEGAVAFVRAQAPDGTPVVDRAVSLDGETIGIPAGDYVLVAYYRPCDRNCGLLDPPKDFCTVEGVLEPGEDYALRITLDPRNPADCILR